MNESEKLIANLKSCLFNKSLPMLLPPMTPMWGLQVKSLTMSKSTLDFPYSLITCAKACSTVLVRSFTVIGGVAAGGRVVLHTLRILFYVRYGVKIEGGRWGWKCKINALSCREANDCSEFEHLK